MSATALGVSARLAAVQALKPVITGKASLATSLAPAQANLSSAEAALAQALAFGVCRFYPRLEFFSRQLLHKPFKAKDLDLQLLLLIGLYQLNTERSASYAVINTAVEASKHLQKGWASKALNACLRNFQRQQTELNQQADAQETSAFSHPKWLLQAFKKAYPKNWRQICEANNLQATLTLRVNQKLNSRAAFLSALNAAGIAATPTEFSPWGVQLAQACHPTSLPGFAEGWFSVQDEAAQLAADLLDVHDGQRVLDACCAPGGKTAHLAESANLELLALDSDAQRLIRVDENLQRLQLKAQVVCADASQPDNWWQETVNGQQFDRILIDAPCSATGVIRRHPDIKLLRRAEDIPALQTKQQQILQALWPLLKTGGKLLYATCSLLPAENQQPLNDFLYTTPDARQLPITANWGVAQKFGRQLLPQAGSHDGFFYCLLEKK